MADDQVPTTLQYLLRLQDMGKDNLNVLGSLQSCKERKKWHKEKYRAPQNLLLIAG